MSRIVEERGGVLVGARSAANVAAGMLILGAIATAVNSVEVAGSFTPQSLDLAVAGVAVLTAAVAVVVPWQRFPPRSTLVLVPVMFLLPAFGNYANPHTLTAGIFFVVIAMWTGLCHPRHTTAWLAPLFAFAFWWPVHLRTDPTRVLIATATVTAVCVTVGEALAYLSARLDRAHQRLLESRERRFAALVERSIDITLLVDGDGVIEYVSPSVTDVFGYTPDQLVGQPLQAILDSTVAELAPDIRDAILSQPVAGSSRLAAHPDIVELRLLHTDGRWIDVEAVAQDRFDDPDLQGLVVNIRDIHHRKRLESQLTHQAFHDDLTGLANRSKFRARVAEQLTRDTQATVIFIDLDGFKRVNDTAGHDRGDDLLVKVAERIARVTRSDDLIARFGGDEFAVLLAPHAENRSASVAARIIDTLAEPFALGATHVTISASAGLAESSGIESADELIRNADTAMYAAKASKTAAVAWFEPSMRDRVVARLDTETRLRVAIDNNEFVVYYQPKIDLRTGQIYGTEALVRWNDPTHGLVGPNDFIHIAEDSGLIVPLGRWVLNTACTDAAAWQHTTGENKRVAINVSPRQFADTRLLHDVTDALITSGLPPELLTIEITESVVVDDIGTAARQLRALKDLGVTLALDDFGTGYSSLRYLQQLPFDLLKIDRSFVMHSTTNPNDAALVGTINRLGHDLGLATLAEGIETTAQAELVSALGCDYAQGFLYSPPVPLADLDTMWSRRWAGSRL